MWRRTAMLHCHDRLRVGVPALLLLAGLGGACEEPPRLVLPNDGGSAGEDGGSGPEESSADCSDGMDNDGDGLIDCGEPACSIHGFCGARSDAGDGSSLQCVNVLDVVFVLDVSTSMANEIEAVRVGLQTIWEQAQGLAPTRFSLVVFVDSVVAVNGCAPFESVADFEAAFAEWRDFTENNHQPGEGSRSNFDCPENILDALTTAATECPWREEATRIAILVTDDTFLERPDELSGIPVESTYAETLAALVENEIRVGAFATPGRGDFCGISESPNAGQGFFDGFAGEPAIPEGTGGTVWSIREVRDGLLNMSAAINQLVAGEYCTPY